MPRLHDIHLRHARHYVAVLEEADALYAKGGEALTRGLELLDQEWSNIQSGQAWAEAHAADNRKAAALCSLFPNAGTYVLGLRQHSGIF